MLCDTQIRNDRRYVVLCSIVKVYNNTTMLLSIFSINPFDTKQNHKIGKIAINDEYYVPIDLLYTHSNSPICIAIDE